jgi:hypothetical protein
MYLYVYVQYVYLSIYLYIYISIIYIYIYLPRTCGSTMHGRPARGWLRPRGARSVGAALCRPSEHLRPNTSQVMVAEAQKHMGRLSSIGSACVALTVAHGIYCQPAPPLPLPPTLPRPTAFRRPPATATCGSRGLPPRALRLRTGSAYGPVGARSVRLYIAAPLPYSLPPAVIGSRIHAAPVRPSAAAAGRGGAVAAAN